MQGSEAFLLMPPSRLELLKYILNLSNSTEDLGGSEITLCNTVIVGTCNHKFVQTHGIYYTRVNPKGKYGLGVIMMCQSRSSIVTNAAL